MFGFSSFASTPFASTAAGDLAPALFVNSNTFYTPTVSAGAVTLAPALFVNSNTFYAPTVGLTLAPALFVNSNTFYGPSVAYLLQPPLLINSNTFYSPTIVPGPVDLAPALFVNSNTFYDAFCYLYPFHPNDLRPGGPSVAPGARNALPLPPSAARGSMPLASSTRQPMPYQ